MCEVARGRGRSRHCGEAHVQVARHFVLVRIARRTGSLPESRISRISSFMDGPEKDEEAGPRARASSRTFSQSSSMNASFRISLYEAVAEVRSRAPRRAVPSYFFPDELPVPAKKRLRPHKSGGFHPGRAGTRPCPTWPASPLVIGNRSRRPWRCSGGPGSPLSDTRRPRVVAGWPNSPEPTAAWRGVTFIARLWCRASLSAPYQSAAPLPLFDLSLRGG